IDYPRGRLILELPDSTAVRASGAITLPMWLAGDHFILARGRIGAAPEAMMFIDTGLAGPMFTAPESTLREAGIGISGSSYEGVSGGGPIKVTPVEAKFIALGPLEAHDVTGLAHAFPPSLERRFGFRIGGLISHGFLRPYAVTFDFVRMEMTLVRQGMR
ncbi:MAG: hypothetical protein JNJ55_15075, partial [Betaproteobacteria bacterium]|nr:hypothetical protein [Betaproteobacteria bacterium]